MTTCVPREFWDLAGLSTRLFDSDGGDTRPPLHRSFIRGGRRDVKPRALEGVSEKAPAAQENGEDVTLERDDRARWKVREDVFAEDGDAREDEPRDIGVFGGLLEEFRNAHPVEADGPIRGGVGNRSERNGRQRRRRFVGPDEVAEINLCKNVPVHAEERTGAQQRACREEGSARSPTASLADVPKANAECFSGPKLPLDSISQMTGHHHDVANGVIAKEVERVREERPPADGKQRLRKFVGERSEADTGAGRKDDGFPNLVTERALEQDFNRVGAIPDFGCVNDLIDATEKIFTERDGESVAAGHPFHGSKVSVRS